MQTDGHAVLDTSNVPAAMQKIFADVGSYYLLSYYSTNPRLDGRFRRIRVEVKRPDVEVRARPGYLAPTEAEARAAGGGTPDAGRCQRAAADRDAGARCHRARPRQPAGAHPGGRRRRHHPRHCRARCRHREAAGMDFRRHVEGSPSNRSAPWAQPGRRLANHHARDRARPAQHSHRRHHRTAAAGRYSVRAELTPRSGRLPIQVTTFATVPAGCRAGWHWRIGAAARPEHRAGLCADRRPAIPPHRAAPHRSAVDRRGLYRRGRVLTREGQPLQLVANYSTRTDARGSILRLAKRRWRRWPPANTCSSCR